MKHLPRGLWILLIANAVIALGYGLIAPALPIFATTFGVSSAAAALVVSSFALMRLTFAPATGRLVTKLGERKIYLTGLLIVALSTFACAFAQNYWQLLTFRAAGGIGSTMFSVSAMALLIRLSPQEVRGRASGYFSAGFLVGSLTGPLIGAALVGFGLRLPFIVYAIALLIAAAVVAAMMPAPPDTAESDAAESDTAESDTAGSDTAGSDTAGAAAEAALPGAPSFLASLRRSEYRAILTSNFAQGWASVGVRVALVPLFVQDGLGYGSEWAGIILACYAAGNVVAILVSGRLSDRYGRRSVMIPGLIVAAAGTLVLGYAPDIWAALILTAVAGVGSGLFAPTHQAALGDMLAGRRRGGSALAAYGMASDLGAVSGPLITGLIADAFGFGPAFAVTGGVVLLALVMWLAVPRSAMTSSAARSADPIRR